MNIEKLKQLKKDAGYTNKMIADESGVPIGTVQKVFSGETSAPRYKTLKAIEAVLIPASGIVIPQASLPHSSSDEMRTSGDGATSPSEPALQSADEGIVSSSDNKTTDPADTAPSRSVLVDMIAQEIIFQIRSALQERGANVYFPAPGMPVQLPGGTILSAGVELPSSVHKIEGNDSAFIFPDVSMVLSRDKITADGIVGVPDLIVEVMDGETRSMQIAIRPELYRRAGVREYWMVDIDAKNITAYDFAGEALPSMFGFSGRVPIKIFGDDCQVNFAQLYGRVGFLFD